MILLHAFHLSEHKGVSQDKSPKQPEAEAEKDEGDEERDKDVRDYDGRDDDERDETMTSWIERV